MCIHSAKLYAKNIQNLQLNDSFLNQFIISANWNIVAWAKKSSEQHCGLKVKRSGSFQNAWLMHTQILTLKLLQQDIMKHMMSSYANSSLFKSLSANSCLRKCKCFLLLFFLFFNSHGIYGGAQTDRERSKPQPAEITILSSAPPLSLASAGGSPLACLAVDTCVAPGSGRWPFFFCFFSTTRFLHSTLLRFRDPDVSEGDGFLLCQHQNKSPRAQKLGIIYSDSRMNI